MKETMHTLFLEPVENGERSLRARSVCRAFSGRRDGACASYTILPVGLAAIGADWCANV
jgi:hypothetical protein